MERPRIGFRVCIGLAAILTCLVGRGVLFDGKTFTPTDFLTSRAPWGGEHATDAFVKNRLQRDIIEFEAMYAIAARESLLKGELLLWNPRIFCGVPSVGDPQLGTFYPPRLLLLRLLAPSLAMNLLALIHFFAAGLAMYALARTWGLGVPASLTTCLTWMLCGQQMVWFKYGGGSPAAVYLPLLALALHRATSQRSLPWMAGAGAIWALMLTGSHPLLSFLALVWTAIVLGCGARAAGGRWFCSSAALFASVAVGLGALQLFPFLDSLQASQKLSTQDLPIFGRPSQILLLGTLFWQRAMGSPIDRVDLAPSWTGVNFFDFQGYIGLLPLVFAVIAWRRSRLLAVTALVLLGLATVYPLWGLILTVLPFLRIIDPHRIYLFAFVASILAGLGFEALLEKPPGRRFLIGAALIATGVLLTGLIGWARSATWLSLGNPAYFALVTATLLSVAALRVLSSPVGPVLKAAAVGIAIAGDLLPGFLSYNTTYDPLPAEPEALRRLPHENRVLVDLESTYFRSGVGNYLMAYGLSTPSGYGSQYPRVYGEMARALGGRVFDDRRVEFPAQAKRGLRMLNVGAVLGPGGEERIDPLPRAWLVGRGEVLPDAGDRLRRLSDPSFDPARSVILEADLPSLTEGSSGTVERIGPEEYRVSCERPSILVVSETYDRGWRGEIDGRSRPILRANHGMRAILVEPGSHRVTFRYRPLSLTFGIACSAATLAALLAWAVRRKLLRPNPTLTARSG